MTIKTTIPTKMKGLFLINRSILQCNEYNFIVGRIIPL